MTKQLSDDDIFKSLSHSIRRDIIKAIGIDKGLPFSGIKKQIDPIESPALSYHLKSLQPLLELKENKYKLSEIGKAAFFLLEKMDQSDRLKKRKKWIVYVFIATEILWGLAMSFLPLIIFGISVPWIRNLLVNVILILFRVINYIIFWILLRKY